MMQEFHLTHNDKHQDIKRIFHFDKTMTVAVTLV